MNACRLENSVYTCAVDSFLEFAFATFNSLIKKVETRSDFFDKVLRGFEAHSFLLLLNDIDTKPASRVPSIYVIN